MQAGHRIERVWRDEPGSGPWRAALMPAALLYGAGRAAHRALYQLGWCRRARLPALVVSVGNLAVGGVGKTPFCAWLAGELIARGRSVVILARGYGRASGARWNEEGEWLARRLPGVRVVQAPDRAVAGARALAAAPADVVLLDDGFQHERLMRDLDIVLLPAAAPFANGQLLPAGPLRERPAALRRAQWVVATRCEQVDAAQIERVRAEVAQLAPDARFASASFPIRALRQGEHELALDWLRGRRVVLCTGVGDPASVRRSAQDLGATIVGERFHPDHHRFTPADLAAANAAATAAQAELVVTAKDAIKLDALSGGSGRHVVLEQGVIVAGGDALLVAIDRGIAHATAPDGRAGAVTAAASPSSP